MKKIISLLVFFFLLQHFSYAQYDTLRVKTSAVCKTCKLTLEESLSFEKGVKKSNLDVESKIMTVIYNPDKTTPEKIRQAIVNTGYDADSLPKNPKAFNRLPDCCKLENGHPE